MLDMGRPVLDQPRSMAQVGSQRHDLALRAEGSAQQADAVQALQPLAILDVALASRHVLHMPGIHDEDLQAAGLQDLIHRDPVHPRRLHDHRVHPAGYQVIGQRVQVRGEGVKPAHRLGGPVGCDRHPDLGTPDVQSRGLGVDDLQTFPGANCRLVTTHGYTSEKWNTRSLQTRSGPIIVNCLAGSASSPSAATSDRITPDQNQSQKRAVTHQVGHGLSLSGDRAHYTSRMPVSCRAHAVRIGMAVSE
jgi:hypothetical protein